MEQLNNSNHVMKENQPNVSSVTTQSIQRQRKLCYQELNQLMFRA